MFKNKCQLAGGLENKVELKFILSPPQKEYYLYNGHSQELLDFCESKQVMPPPLWSPTGGSGQWDWEEQGESWAWHPDVKSEKEKPRKFKKESREGFAEYFKRIFRGSFSSEKKKS